MGRLLLPLLLLALARRWGCPSGAEAAALTPDWTTCSRPKSAPADIYVNCCTLPELMRRPGAPHPDAYIELAEYLRENPRARPRIRPAAHLPTAAGNKTYLEQLNRAFRLLRHLPPEDPRSLARINDLHCMYGSVTDGTVMQLGFPALEYSIHRNWLVMPWHRWFTFFFERIVAKVVGDDDFALPFWNWDNQSAELGEGHTFLPNVVPHFYRDPEAYPELVRAVRDPRHTPGNPDHLVDLTYSYPDSLPADRHDLIRRVNNQRLYEYVVETAARSASGASGEEEEDDDPQAKFLSARFHAGGSTRDIIIDNPRSGITFEQQIHSAIHGWLADHDRGRQDMGAIFASLNDPLFFAHHTNVDRLWAEWQKLGGRDFHDPDFLDAAFFFYNENAQLVRVTVRDALDHRTLGYDWQQVENPWMSAPPQIESAASQSLSAAAAAA